ncbi:MAG TPA: DUF58 domain-containing protein [Candidatus Thermoplasmatota archaeon]|nr:DUF58 domain-containing protein [Candidatus Thermoplasmatota archaeon]
MWTRKASLLTGLGALALALGLVARSPAAVAAGLATLAFVVVNRLLFRGSAEVHAAREMDLYRVFEGDATRVQVHLQNPGKRLLFLEVRDRLPRQLALEEGAAYDFVALPRGGRDELDYTARAPLLGVYEVGPTDLRVEDPFGLFFEERALGGSTTLWVLPRKEDLRKAALVSNLPMPLLGEHQVNRPGDGFDFFALREYVPGDTMRSVNWKASARSGKMMVNQMMRTTAAEVAVFVDGRAVTGVGAEERAARVTVARAAASAVDFIYARKDNARVILYADHVSEIEPQPAERMLPLVLQTLAEMVPKGDVPFVEAVRQVLPSLKRQTPVLIVSPLVDDGTIVEGVSTLLANDMIVNVISPEPEPIPGADPRFDAALRAEREAVLQDLRGFGAGVITLAPGASLAAAIEKGRVMVA